LRCFLGKNTQKVPKERMIRFYSDHVWPCVTQALLYPCKRVKPKPFSTRHHYSGLLWWPFATTLWLACSLRIQRENWFPWIGSTYQPSLDFRSSTNFAIINQPKTSQSFPIQKIPIFASITTFTSTF
jgi:hypothetical protein